MLDGVMLLWFVLTAFALVFVAIDIRTTPESPVLKWGFVLVTAYTGVLGAFLYVLGCRAPLPGTHARYVAPLWRQTLGSTMHCVAGDGVGIVVGAVLARALGLTGLGEAALEYALGFAFGWMVFQALFMRDMVGGSYARSLTSTFIPELLSMNLLMAGMVPTMMILQMRLGTGTSPATPAFWFVMSMALLVGFIVAYPINWWLVRFNLKHGMMTLPPASAPAAEMPASHAMGTHAGHGAPAVTSDTPHAMETMAMDHAAAPWPPVPVMTVASFLVLAAGLALSVIAVPM